MLGSTLPFLVKVLAGKGLEPGRPVFYRVVCAPELKKLKAIPGFSA